MEYKEIDLRNVLDHIPCSGVSYQEWIDVGMALKYEGYPVDVWDDWSREDFGRYKSGVCAKKWDTFGGSGTPVTAGTIIQMAKDRGYKPASDVKVFDWDDYIGTDKYDTAWVEPEPLKKTNKINEYNELTKYLNALFNPEDKVCIVTNSFKDNDEKYKPNGKGMTRTAAEWLTDLDKHKDDVCAAIGDYNTEAGAWIRFNPMDGKGVKNENVTEFRYALIESDDNDLEIQNALIRDMKLPVAALVYSGGKSLHAIVHVDAPGIELYKQRVNKLYEKCELFGLKVDKQNKNPSRLSRLPGVKRYKKWQYIIDTNIGFPNFEDWEEYIDQETDSFPNPEDMFSGEKLPLPPELIKGILRQGGKMSLTGPSKAGKSFLLMQLAIGIATGSVWLGHSCEQKKVLYINFEIDRASMQDRYWNICEAMEIEKSTLSGQLDTWNMKGHEALMSKLKDSLVRRCIKGGYGAVIVDPIYKTLTGDENSATDMSTFTRFLDEICNKTGASIIYAHHHSKGAQGGKSAADRSSGSGVFARDPNAIVDMIELIPEDVDGMPVEIPEGATAWRIECTLRDFATPAPFEIVFQYPHHMVWNGLQDAREMYQPGQRLTRGEKQQKGRDTQKRNVNKRNRDLITFITEFTKEKGLPPSIKEASDALGDGFAEVTIRRKEDQIPGLQIKNNMLFYSEDMDFDSEIE